MLKALLYAAVVVFLPSSLFAAPIVQEEDPVYGTLTFETTLTLHSYIEYPPFSSDLGKWHSMPLDFTTWEVPMFDYALGTPLALLLNWDATGPGSHTTVISNDPVPPPIMVFISNFNETTQGSEGVFAQVYPLDPSLPITWEIWIHPDSHSYYDPNYAATFDVLLTGPATATYYYIPAAIPEPATLLLLGSGLIGAEWKRRRRQG